MLFSNEYLTFSTESSFTHNDEVKSWIKELGVYIFFLMDNLFVK